MIQTAKRRCFFILLLYLFGCCFSARAFAASKRSSRISGFWRLKNIKCSSGAKAYSANEITTVVVTGAFYFYPDNRVVRGIKLLVHLNNPQKDIQSTKDYISVLQGDPSPDKSEKVESLTKTLTLFEQYASGRECPSVQFSQTYYLNGTILTLSFSENGRYQIECPTGHVNVNTSELEQVYSVKVRGSNLQLTDTAPDGNGASCPAGDHEIYTYIRKKTRAIGGAR